MTHLKKNLQKKGFTLIEVLIVVVIIGILASLILPRMLAQPERAITAEGLNYLGVLRRSQDAQSQPSGVFVAANSGAPGANASDAGWRALGMGEIPAGSRFSYTCAPGVDGGPGPDGIPGNGDDPADTNADCTATRVAGGPRGGGTIQMDLTTGFIMACGAPYTMTGAANTQAATCV